MRAYLMEAWGDSWKHKEPCRQTKIWLPTPDPRKGRLLIKLKRLTLGTVTRWITGHNFLRRHQHLLTPESYSTPTCRLCKAADETSSHLSLECPILDDTRLKFLRHRRPKLPPNWETHQLVNFLDFIAQPMEDTTPDPKTLTVYNTINATRTIPLDPLEVPPESPLNSSEDSTNSLPL